MFYTIKDITIPGEKRYRAVRIDDIDNLSELDGTTSLVAMKSGARYVADVHFHHLVHSLNRAAAELEKTRTYLAPADTTADADATRPAASTPSRLPAHTP